MTDVPYLLLDVFTDRPFEGNPLAVVIDPPALGSATMASIAREFNLSETIFVRSESPARWSTRIFTPARELPFAGHPTVGAAVALALTGRLGAAPMSDLVLAEVAGDVAVTVTQATVPSATFVAPTASRLVASPDRDTVTALLAAVGLQPGDALTALDVGVWDAGVPMAVVPVGSVEVLGRARPDAAALEVLTDAGIPAEVYLLAPASSHAGEWRARMFAPGSGIAEDPATGSAACAAAGLLATVAADGAASWRIDQGVEMGRPSVLHLSATVRRGTALDARLGGSAVLVGEGTLHLPDED